MLSASIVFGFRWSSVVFSVKLKNGFVDWNTSPELLQSALRSSWMKFQPGVNNASGVHQQFCHLLLIVGAPDFRNCRFSFLVRFYTRLLSQFFQEKRKKKPHSVPGVSLSPAVGPVVSAAASRTLNLHAVLLRDGERGFLPPPCFSFPSF